MIYRKDYFIFICVTTSKYNEIYYNLENLSLKFLLKLMTSNQIGTEFVLIKIEEKLS